MKLLFLIIEFVLIFWAITFIAQLKINHKHILVYALAVICPVLIFLWIGQWQGIIFIIISFFLYFYWLTKRYVTLIHLCFVVIIGVITDNVSQYAMNVFPYNFLPSILEQYFIFIILFIISTVAYRLLTRRTYIVLGKNKSPYLLIIFIAFVTMSTFYINLYLSEYFSQDSLLKFNIVSQFLYFTIMLFVLYFTTKNIKKENNIQKIKFETEQFTDYMHSMELINHEMQKFRHDHANILFTMQGYIELDDFEGLKKYFKKHIFTAEEDTLKRNEQLANISKLHITGIKGLILTKTLQAEKEGILVDLEIADEIDDINMNIIDFARILGIFFDNAIEAIAHTDSQKEIGLAFFKSTPDSLMIIIENTVVDEPVNIEQIFTENFSTKGQNRGKGLSTVKSILNNYPNVTLNTNVEDGLFTQTIIIE
ncbi:sensor histidine kinase [Solibacillus sp. FSL K6-1523]|uniref:sensor histidine kinase n=1 Tax=Solibacillus sp. FSL K6-1523 TaxID=2921471 RepID=UPI0030FB46BA